MMPGAGRCGQGLGLQQLAVIGGEIGGRRRASATIAIRAQRDVETLPRIVGLFAQRGIIPNRVECREEGAQLLVNLELGPLDDLMVKRLVAKLRASVLVEQVFESECGPHSRSDGKR